MTGPVRISIVIPTFNRAACIERAIGSVRNQTSPHWELIVVDDGSTDATRTLVEPCLADARVKYAYKENGGVASARNLGVHHASFEFVTFLDSDDEFLPSAVETMCCDASLLQGNVGILLYGRIKISRRSTFSEPLLDRKVINYQAVIRGSWPNIDTTQLCRKELFKIAQFPETPKALWNIDSPKHIPESLFWFRVLRRGTQAMLRSKKISLYHWDGEDRLTGGRQHSRRAKTMPAHLSDFLNEFGSDYAAWNPKGLAKLYIEKAIFEIVDNRSADGRISILQGLQYHPTILPRLLYLLSFFPNRLFVRAAALCVDAGL